MLRFTGYLLVSVTCLSAQGAGPCSKVLSLAANPKGASTFCVAFALSESGKLVILPEDSEAQLNHTYDSMPPAERNLLKNQWNAYISAALAKQSALYEYALTSSERDLETAGKLPKPTQDAIAELLQAPRDWAHARLAYNRFERCPDRPGPCNRRGAEQLLGYVLNLVVNVDFLNEAPLSNPDPQGLPGIAYLFVDDLIQDFRKQVNVVIKGGAAGLQPPRNPISADWVYLWLDAEQKGKVWAASDISQRLGSTLSDIGVQADVSASRAGVSPKLTIDEPLVHVIRMPGDLDPSKPGCATEILKILSVLLAQEDYSRVLQSKLTKLISPAGPPGMMFQELDLAKVRGNKGLAYLDLFQFPEEQAALQEIGYVVSTQAEPNTDSSVATTLILNVGKPDSEAPSKRADSAPDAQRKKNSPAQAQPVAVANTAQALAPLRGQPVSPETPEAAPPGISTPHFTIGAGVQYRSGQGVRPLLSGSSTDFPVPWGVMRFEGTAGVENTNSVAALNWNNDYIGFAKLHHRLGLSFAGKTDSTANRLLGSNAESNERKTGGQGRLEYDALNNWHGIYVQLFGQGARQNLSFRGGGTNLPNAGLWTADAGATIDVLHEARPWPGRFEITPQVHFGDQTAALTKPYTVWSLDASAHRRISDFQLISMDISGHFRDATRSTPVFELPSLGGGESLRGFRPDDVLARRYWSLQNEVWMPVPGTLAASPGGKGLGAAGWFLRQNVRLAFFADVAGAYQIPAGGESGIRWAPGLGIRFVRGNFALKLDWAYGQGRGQSGSGHGRTDLGVTQTGAF